MQPKLAKRFMGRSVLVTGGSSGIGLSCARQLVSVGATVTLAARRMDALERARAFLLEAAPGATIHLLSVDVADEAAVESVVGRHLSQHPIDMLFNNAGVVMPGRFLELSQGHLREMMEINYFGAVNMCRVVLPHLIQRGGGAVLNMSSMAGVIAIYGYTGYAASKYALLGFSEALRAEMWPHNIQVSVCLPPDTDTPQLEFENRFKPPETKAIAGTVKTLTADDVAREMLTGLAKGRFHIVPGNDAPWMWRLQRFAPGIVRWICDRAQRQSQTTKE